MQTLPTSHRSSQRRTPAVDTSAPPQAATMNNSPSQSTPGPRSSSGSARSSTYRRQNVSSQEVGLTILRKSSLADTVSCKPTQQLSQIEKSVTHLLIATKQLLETLTQWSRHTATEGEVSDVYVRLGYEFNIACRAFTSIGVDTSDLGPVPELLRAILEETLSQEASSASLDKFLPRIRDIIITLLHGLKRKQQKLRSRQVRDSPSSTGTLNGTGSSGSLNAGLNQMLDDVPSRRSGSSGTSRRTGSGGSTLIGDNSHGDVSTSDENGIPPRFSSIHPARQNSGSASADSSSRNAKSQKAETEKLSVQRAPSQRNFVTSPQPPPPPPPPKQDALLELQRSSDLERRASRRYSAYQISKHLGASPNGVPMLPPAQNSPIPNRGRDVRESMNAVRVRGAETPNRQRSNNHFGEPISARNQTFAQRISEESLRSNDTPEIKSPIELSGIDSPMLKTPVDKLRAASPSQEADLQEPAARVWINESQGTSIYGGSESDSVDSSKPSAERQYHPGNSNEIHAQNPTDLLQSQEITLEQSPQPNKELTLFLQYKSKIKKFVLPEGTNGLSIARLQLAFIEKFAWSTHNNGNDLPEIYIQDPVSGVRHELEDLSDVKDRSVLVLNVEVLDEVKRHIDEGLGGLRRMVEGVRTVVDGQQSVIQRVADRQQDVSKEVTRMAAPKVLASRITSFEKPQTNGIRVNTSTKDKSSQIAGIQSLRQDLAVVRQTFSSLVSDLNSSITVVNSKASSIKAMTLDGIVSLDSSTGRSHVNAGKKLLGEESEIIVNRVDDLQDIVEDLRKDVVSRGVRPLPRQLESVSKSISSATAELKKMQEYLKREKPIWTKIWEKELELVCNDRDLLTMQEELAADLEDDLEKATQTFALVEQATKQQHLGSAQGGNSASRVTPRGLSAITTDQVFDPVKAKDGVLGEVRALRPNHETRLEAIERAEKARQKELESRREGEFTKELGIFVEEGKLKKSGGIEEAERLRKTKDERNRREAWEKQQEKGKAVEAPSSQSELGEVQSPGGKVSMEQEPEFLDAPEQSVTDNSVKEGGHP